MIREWLYKVAGESSFVNWLRAKHPLFFAFILSQTRGMERRKIRVVTIDAGIFMTEKLCDSLPRDYDCVIGIPRAGLLFANIAAMKLGLPLSTPDNFVKGIVWSGWNKFVEKPEYKKVLLFNDDVTDGLELGACVNMLKEYDPTILIETATLSMNPNLALEPDFHVFETFMPTVFEWSFIHHPIGRDTCVDLDGVLCKDEDRNQPYIIPRYSVKSILTARLESERENTESWLKRNGVKYETLVMRPVDETGQIAYKIKRLNLMKPFWYWESNPEIAATLASATGIPILCIQDMKVYHE